MLVIEERNNDCSWYCSQLMFAEYFAINIMLLLFYAIIKIILRIEGRIIWIIPIKKHGGFLGTAIVCIIL